MAAHTAIADVGQTLVAMLNDRLGDAVEDDEVVLASPGEEGPGEDFRLTVYLYDVRENEHLSNDRARPESTGRPAGASLVLDLHYLVTAHPKQQQRNDGPTKVTSDQHEMLGRAMQILADNAIVRKPDLDEDLSAEDVVTISIAPTERRDLLDVWGTFPEVPYQPSVPYVVSPVVIDGEAPDAAPRVLEGEFSQYAYRSVGDGDDGGDA